MKRNHLIAGAAIAIAFFQTPAAAQGQGRPHLNTGGKWDECSIQLAPTLTQRAWRQFTQEAGLVAYFRPLATAARERHDDRDRGDGDRHRARDQLGALHIDIPRGDVMSR